jgi:uncharacterized membrane protein YraQ (UPF0718 family)
VPLFLYTLYRVLVLAAAFGLLLLAGAHEVLAAAVAVVVAFLVSYLFLRGPRDAATAWLAARAEARAARRAAGPQSRFAKGVAEDERLEDAAADDDR